MCIYIPQDPSHPSGDGPPRSAPLAPVCTGGGGAEAGRSVHGGAVHGVRRVHWPGGAGCVQAMAEVVHGMRHSLLDLEGYNYAGSSAEPAVSSTMGSTLRMDS